MRGNTYYFFQEESIHTVKKLRSETILFHIWKLTKPGRDHDYRVHNTFNQGFYDTDSQNGAVVECLLAHIQNFQSKMQHKLITGEVSNK